MIMENKILLTYNNISLRGNSITLDSKNEESLILLQKKENGWIVVHDIKEIVSECFEENRANSFLPNEDFFNEIKTNLQKKLDDISLKEYLISKTNIIAKQQELMKKSALGMERSDIEEFTEEISNELEELLQSKHALQDDYQKIEKVKQNIESGLYIHMRDLAAQVYQKIIQLRDRIEDTINQKPELALVLKKNNSLEIVSENLTLFKQTDFATIKSNYKPDFMISKDNLKDFFSIVGEKYSSVQDLNKNIFKLQ